MNKQSDRNLFGLDLQELTALVEESGDPSYRGRQLFQALYRDRADSAEQITTLPKEFRAWLLARGLEVTIPVD